MTLGYTDGSGNFNGRWFWSLLPNKVARDTSWKRDNFDTNGVFKEVKSFSLTEVLTHESNHNEDLNNDGGIGEVIITNVTQNNDFGLYITASEHL